ncbi:MAG: hypothetical protein QOJ29_5406 [Thermoleophilaceae bacterium]|nr:hypothetical protein [Thermoleophilaceae bacterium]
MPASEDPFRKLARPCPHCGAREVTLGSQCPACGRSYEPRSWVDQGPFSDLDDFATGPGGAVIVFLLELLGLIASGTLALLKLPWAIARRLTSRRGH